MANANRLAIVREPEITVSERERDELTHLELVSISCSCGCFACRGWRRCGWLGLLCACGDQYRDNKHRQCADAGHDVSVKPNDAGWTRAQQRFDGLQYTGPPAPGRGLGVSESGAEILVNAFARPSFGAGSHS